MMQVSGEEVSKLLVSGIEPIKYIDPCFAEFTYTPRSLPDDSTPMVRTEIIKIQECYFTIILHVMDIQYTLLEALNVCGYMFMILVILGLFVCPN